jgi:hypothetical protein
MKLAIHIHLVPRLRLRGAISPTPQIDLMAWCLSKQQICIHIVAFS